MSELTNKSIVITGGAGAFGKAFVQRCLREGAKRVGVFSRDEAKHASMLAEVNDPRLRTMVGDVRDLSRLTEATRGVDIVIHAAALKRVEVAERDPAEATATNVDGSLNVAKACIANGVSKGLLLSTDKAAAPNTLYGATKLCAERLFNGAMVYAAGTPTKLTSTRYGNVAGSTGSVIPIWQKQRASGKISVTSPTMTRFLMSMDDAVNLVVLALSRMRGSEVFVPKLKASTIEHLAKAIAPECEIQTIGIRPGEKMHECLITEDEARDTYDLGDCYVIEPFERTWGEVAPINAPKVPAGFEYKSSTAPHFSVEELKRFA